MLRFGTNPAQSVFDLNCKAHQLDNLCVTDASFFPSIGACNTVAHRQKTINAALQSGWRSIVPIG